MGVPLNLEFWNMEGNITRSARFARPIQNILFVNVVDGIEKAGDLNLVISQVQP
jgi:hypothetical protein